MSGCKICGKELYTGRQFCSDRCYWNFRKGKSFNELMGEEKSREIKNKQRQKALGRVPYNKGKTYEELYGIEKAKNRRELTKLLCKGKTWKERYGQEKAKYLRKNVKKFRSYDDIRGNRNPAKRPEVREKIRKNKLETVEKWLPVVLKSLHKRPTHYEERMLGLIKEYKLSYKYCGDGSVIIGRRAPDFINCNSEKIVLEVYSKAHLGYFKPKNYEEVRSRHFVKYGYRVVYFTQEDLFRENWKEHCLKKIGGVYGFTM